MNQADGSKLYKAARAGDLKIIHELLPKFDVKQAVDKDWLDRSLEQAVYGKSMPAVDLLLKAGANPNKKASCGTLIAYPAGNGDLSMVKKLIEGGADYNREVERETALSAALEYSQTPVIEYLEKLGAYSPPDTTLFCACANGDIKLAKKALAQGVDLEKTGGTFGETPLMVAARKGQVEAVKLLLKHGANPSQRKGGECVLRGAIKYGKNPEIFEVLVAAGADIHAKYYGETLLMTAIQAADCLPIVKRLVELGIKINSRDKNIGATALDVARTHKRKEIIAYLTSLGAKAERDAAHSLMMVLAQEFGGKVSEYSHGYRLASKLSGHRCEFDACLDKVKVVIRKLNYADAELKRAKSFKLIVGTELAKTPEVEINAASKLLGVKVKLLGMKNGAHPLTQEFITNFCRRQKLLLQQLNLADGERVLLASEGASFVWKGMESKKDIPRLKIFARFVQSITKPPEPERSLFPNEWLIKPATKTAGTPIPNPHTLGGVLPKPVACPHCGLATNLMANIDLSDPTLPVTALGRGKLPVFWCLDCGEWDATFFDISSPIPGAIAARGGAVKVGDNPAGEDDLPERRVMLVPVSQGRKAGRKSKIGGSPAWIQSESTPGCPKCEKPMAFVLQLAGDSRISYCDMGMLYAFACPDCQVTASLIQSH